MLKELPFSLEFRTEGNDWSCYLVTPSSPVGDLRLGSISHGLVRDNKDLKKEFIVLMMNAMNAVLKELVNLELDTTSRSVFEAGDTRPKMSN